MASAYPTTLDTLATNKADATTTPTDHPGHHNDLADAVNKIETELGTLPKGPYASNVRNRFEILDWKRSCKLAATLNVAGTYATGPPATKAVGGTSLAVDGVNVANGDRVFLPCQTTPAENGIYTVSGVGTSIVLTRSYDADDASKLSDSQYVSVEQGAVHKDTTWELQTDNPITVGTTALYYTRVTPTSLYAPRDWFAFGSSLPASGNYQPPAAPVIAETIPRLAINGTLTHSVSAAHQLTAIVLPAGRTITNVNFIYSQALGTITTFWVSLVRASDRQILATSANSATAWAAAPNTKTTALSSPYTPPCDTMAYVGIACQATTAAIIACVVGNANYNGR